MEQLIIGKELPNLKITLAGLESTNSNSNMETDVMEIEEQDNKTNENDKDGSDVKVDVKLEFMSYKGMKKYENKGGCVLAGAGLDLTSEEVQEKLEKRAARFQMETRKKNKITEEEVDALYKSLKINIGSEKSPEKSKGIRLDAIHIRGVNDMSTEDIFTYFGEYGPSSIEWINDVSCNAVWLDESSAALALLGLSRPLILHRRKKSTTEEKDVKIHNEEVEDEEKVIEGGEEVVMMSDDESSEEEENAMVDDTHQKDTGIPSPSIENAITYSTAADMLTTSMDSSTSSTPLTTTSSPEDKDVKLEEEKVDEELPLSVPPGYWRLGVPHTKAKAILLRFATKDDKKIRGAEKRSTYYKKYGNPNYGGMKGLISTSRKRRFWQIQQKKELQELGIKHDEVADEGEENNTKPGETSSAESENEMHDEPVKPAGRKLRMKMYADEEEKKQKKKRLKLVKSSRKRVPSGSKKRRMQSVMVANTEREESDGSFDDDRNDMVADNFHHSGISVWERLNNRDENNSVECEETSDLRNKLQPRRASMDEWTRSVTPITGDLRGKLDQIRNKHDHKHRTPLLIHVANDQTD